MDQNRRTLNPVQSFNPPIESDVNLWPQLLICDQESADASHLEYPSFKKPRSSQATMVSRMDQNPRTLNPIQRPIESSVNFWPQLLTCDQESANASHLEYPSFKKPRTPETTMVSRTSMLVNKPTLEFRFRSEPCLQFKRGNCCYGEKCSFAHGNGEIRNWYENQEIITTMRLCRWYSNGEKCPYGERCHFLHEELAKFRKSGTVGPGGFLRHGCDQLESLDAYRVSPKPVFWKTRLCNKWEATRYCPYGVNCTYAHGHAELQKFGSQTAMERGNGSASKMIPTVVMHASHSRTACGRACEQKMQDKKCSFKWKGFEKISHIYADWIDDMPLVHSSLGKVES